MKTLILSIILTLISAFFNATGFLFFKKGSKQFSLNIFKLIKNIDLIIGGCSFITGVIIYLFALRLGSLSFLYPVAASQYLFVLYYGKKYYNEKITQKKLIGVLLIIIGISIIGLS